MVSDTSQVQPNEQVLNCVVCGVELEDFHLDRGYDKCSECARNRRNQIQAQGDRQTTCANCGNELSEFNIENGHSLCQECSHRDTKPRWQCNFEDCRSKKHSFQTQWCLKHLCLDMITWGEETLEFLWGHNIEIDPVLEQMLDEAKEIFKNGSFQDSVTKMEAFASRNNQNKFEADVEKFTRDFVPLNISGMPYPEGFSTEARQHFDVFTDAVGSGNRMLAYSEMEAVRAIVQREAAEEMARIQEIRRQADHARDEARRIEQERIEAEREEQQRREREAELSTFSRSRRKRS